MVKKKNIKVYKVSFDKGRARLIPANLRSFELIPQNVIKGCKEILKEQDKKAGKSNVRNLL